MATTAWVAKQKRRAALVKKYADLRRQLKKEKNFAALAKLPRDSSPTRSHLRCAITGRSKGNLRKFQVCRICFSVQAPRRASARIVRHETPLHRQTIMMVGASRSRRWR